MCDLIHRSRRYDCIYDVTISCRFPYFARSHCFVSVIVDMSLNRHVLLYLLVLFLNKVVICTTAITTNFTHT